jgi:phosphatidylglycerophosphate synthase
MGYLRTFLTIEMLFAHSQSNALMVFTSYVLNLCVIDNLDGVVARKLQQCTSLGRVLDIGLDLCSEVLLLCCLYAASSGSHFVPHFMQRFDLWACIVLNHCGKVVACFASIAITFAGRNWKDLEYPCPITRWLYGMSWGPLPSNTNEFWKVFVDSIWTALGPCLWEYLIFE